jgi:hypothetical protein
VMIARRRPGAAALQRDTNCELLLLVVQGTNVSRVLNPKMGRRKKWR